MHLIIFTIFAANKETTDDEIEQMLENGNVAVFTGDVWVVCFKVILLGLTWFLLQIVVQTQEARQALADIEARHKEIIKLEQNIRELRDLFIEMASLVETQVKRLNK